jgi:ribosomal protein S18 acetylase RimI-like enzyme
VSPLTIRLALPEEVSILCDLERKIFGESDGFVTPDLWEGVEAFFIIHGQEIVGSIAFQHNADIGESYDDDCVVCEGTLYLISIGIVPEWQGKGIGTRAKEWELAYARSKRYNRVVANTRLSNKISIHLHLKYGFKVTRIVSNYYEDPTEDAVVLEYLF